MVAYAQSHCDLKIPSLILNPRGVCRKSGIKFTPDTAPGPPEARHLPDKASTSRTSMAQAVRAGSKRASMMAESLLSQLQVGTAGSYGVTWHSQPLSVQSTPSPGVIMLEGWAPDTPAA